jgi:elongation factor G
MVQPIQFRETIRQTAIGERRYVRFLEGSGHFAHLQLQLKPMPATPCAITRSPGLIIPDACYAAARDAVQARLKSGLLGQFPMDAFQVEFTNATYLVRYSHPEAFAAVASMAFDDALGRAKPVIIEPWIGLRLRVERNSAQVVLATLARLLGEISLTVSLSDYFVLKVEIPQRVLNRLRLALGVRLLETFPLPPERLYRIISGPVFPTDEQAPNRDDWT